MLCHVQRTGDPSDLRLYYFFLPIYSFSGMEKMVELNSAVLAAMAC
jgi:hypothetical protein